MDLKCKAMVLMLPIMSPPISLALASAYVEHNRPNVTKYAENALVDLGISGSKILPRYLEYPVSLGIQYYLDETREERLGKEWKNVSLSLFVFY